MTSFVHNPPKSTAKYNVGGYTNGKNGSTGTDALVQIQDLKDLIASGGTGGGTGGVTNAQLSLALQSYVKTSGSTMTGQLNTVTPAATGNAANKLYVDTAVADVDVEVQTKLSKYGDTCTGYLKMTLQPAVSTDLCNKAYVDDAIASVQINDPNLLDIINMTPTANCTLGTNATDIVLLTPTQQRAAINVYSVPEVTSVLANYLTLSGGTMTGKITGIQTPTNPTDAVNKAYADMLVAGLTFKPAVACYATEELIGTFVINGDNQTIVLYLFGGNTIDGYTLQLNDRVLVNFGALSNVRPNNGVYQVTSFSTNGTLFTRSTDLDGSPLSEFEQGDLFYVANGTVYGGSLFVQTSQTPEVLGTSPIIYSQYAAAKNIAAGANISITGNAIAVNSSLTGISAISGLSTVAINGTSSSDALTLRKATGGAAYTLALPSAAPASNTYLKYDGTNYAWSSAGSALTAFTGATSIANGTLGGVPAPLLGQQDLYLKANGNWATVAAGGTTPAIYLHMVYSGAYNANLPTQNSKAIPFNTVISSSAITNVITVTTTAAETTFTVAPGYIYKCTASMAYNTIVVDFIYQWRNMSTGTNFGVLGDLHSTAPRGNTAIGYIANTGTTAIVIAVYVTNGGAFTTLNTGGALAFPWCTIEVVSNNNTISAFTGATSAAAGSIGYIPAPQAGDQVKFLSGSGNWATAVTAGSNLTITGSSIALNSSLTGISTITDLSAPVANADATNKQYVDAQDLTKLSLSGGTMSGAINMGGQAISNVSTLAINGTSSSDALTLAKATGGAAYTLALPAAAPAAGTYLQYDGANYAWASNAAQYMYATSMGDQTIPGGTGTATPYSIRFPDIILTSSHITHAAASTTVFSLPAGATYILKAMLNNVSATVWYRWANVTTGAKVFIGGGGGQGNLTTIGMAIAYITTTAPTSVSLCAQFGTGASIRGQNDTYGRGPWISIESLGSSGSGTSSGGGGSTLIAGYNLTITGTTIALNSSLDGISTINGLSAPVAATDAVNKQYVDAQDASIMEDVDANLLVLTNNLAYLEANVEATKLPLAGGTMTGAINMGGQAITNAASIALNGTSSSDALTLSKATGGAAYTLALPAAAPTASTYLKYDGANYAWDTAGSALTAFTGATSGANGSLGGVPAPLAGDQTKYLQGNGTWSAVPSVSAVAANYYLTTVWSTTAQSGQYFPWHTLASEGVVNAGTAITSYGVKWFKIEPGYTVKCSASLSYAIEVQYVKYQWFDYTNSQQDFGIGMGGGISNAGNPQNNIAIAIVTTASTAKYVGLKITSSFGVPVFGTNALYGGQAPWAYLEVISTTNNIAAFTGATSSAAGSIGYIPAPVAGDQGKFLSGSGQWADVAVTTKQYFIATNSATLAALASTAYLTFYGGNYYSGSNVSQFSPSVYMLASGHTYKISFTCDIYSGLTATGAFAIAQSTTSTLPASISNWTTQTLGNSYNSASNSAAYYKPVCNGYITTTTTMYVGIIYTGSGNGANIANGLLTIDVL